jgi:hypothetical protein
MKFSYHSLLFIFLFAYSAAIAQNPLDGLLNKASNALNKAGSFKPVSLFLLLLKIPYLRLLFFRIPIFTPQMLLPSTHLISSQVITKPLSALTNIVSNNGLSVKSLYDSREKVIAIPSLIKKVRLPDNMSFTNSPENMLNP